MGLLISWKAEIDPRDHDGLSPLDYTFDENTGKMLRKHGAVLSLFGSVQGGHADRVRLLIKQGASLTERNKLERTVVHIASEKGEVGVLRVLLAAEGKNPETKQNEKLCDINAQDYIGWTPMHYAVGSDTSAR